MKTIMVTGAGGFIGQHTVRALLELGYGVVGVDCRHDPLMQVDPWAGGEKRLQHSGQPLPSGSQWRPRVVDIRNEIPLSTLFERTRPDAVIHLAAQSSVVDSWKDPLADARANIIGTLNVVAMCQKYHVERIIYAASGGTVYGNHQGPLAPQEWEPLDPQSPYGVSKMAGEFYVRQSGISHAVLRYPNVYGPGQPVGGASGVVAIFAGNVLLDIPCIIWGDGQNTRDYVFVKDVVNANIAALEGEADGVFNVGSGRGISVKEVLDTVAATIGKTPVIEYKPARPGDVRHISLNPEKFKTNFTWSPVVSFSEGVAMTVDALTRAGQVASRRVHGPEVAGSIPAPATKERL